MLQLLLYIVICCMMSFSTSFSIMSMNTLSSGDCFASDYGCMAEIIRRDNLMEFSNMSVNEAEGNLLQQRYKRLSRYINDVKSFTNIIALQELDLESVEGGEYLLKYFSPNNDSWTTACEYGNSYEKELLMIDQQNLSVIKANTFDLNGVIGCSALLSGIDFRSGNMLTVTNLHISAGVVRNPDTVNQTMQTLLDVLPAVGPVIACGDFNAHIPDLISIIKELDTNGNHVWMYLTASNCTTINSPESVECNSNRNYFTTQNEHNFVAAYDGCILRTESHNIVRSSVIILENGFMPKYLGTSDSYGESEFAYSDGDFPIISGVLQVNDVDLSVGNAANYSLSDHLAVVVTVDLE